MKALSEALEKIKCCMMCEEAWVVARIEPQKPHQTFNGSREFQRDVLAYLKEHGPQLYDVLYVHFAPNYTAEIKSVLPELLQWKFIDRAKDSDMTVSITASGITRLGFTDIGEIDTNIHWKRKAGQNEPQGRFVRRSEPGTDSRIPAQRI